MNLRPLTLFLLFILFTKNSFAGIFCPPTMYLHCDDDISDTNLTMMPTLLGAHANYPAIYVDELHLNTCNVGYVIRTWFGDANYNYQLDEFEPYCEQTIYLAYRDQTINVTFPNDLTLTCLAEVPSSSPTIYGGPCDLIGVSTSDQYFEFVGDACRKIVRHFTVINWCTYDPSNPDWNGQGYWEDEQVIKIIDKEGPTINCIEKDFEVGANCLTEVVLENSALDNGACPSDKLSWTVEVDLWADGIVDYRYGYLESGIFNIPLKNNGDKVNIKIPELVSPGHHKVVWKVKDSCGNLSSCSSKFNTLDKKPPTPYCEYIVNAAINGEDGWPLNVHASLFNRGAFDNCTSQEDIKFSFSPNVNDSIRQITCNNAGFQFFQIYATDLAGNQDFCEVYMIVFDNGTCNTRLSAFGYIRSENGMPIPNVVSTLNKNNIEMMTSLSDESGSIHFDDFGANEEYTFVLQLNEYDLDGIDLFDYFALRDHLLGKSKLVSYASIAADVDNDYKITAKDLKVLKELLLKSDKNLLPRKWDFVSNNEVETIGISSMRNQLWLGKCNGSLNFTGIKKANIVNELEQRSQEGILCHLVERTDGNLVSWDIVLDQDLEMDGLIANATITSNILKIESLNNKSICFDKHQLASSNVVATIFDQNDLSKLKFFNQLENRTYTLDQLIKKKQNDQNMLYPNPAKDQITIAKPFSSKSQIFNAQGKIVMLINENQTAFNINQFPVGIYFLKNNDVVIKFVKI